MVKARQVWLEKEELNDPGSIDFVFLECGFYLHNMSLDALLGEFVVAGYA